MKSPTWPRGCGTAGRTTPRYGTRPTGRFIDRDKLHHVDFPGAPSPSRAPRSCRGPPQGHPVRVVDATDGHARQTAARYADVALVRAASAAQAAAVRDRTAGVRRGVRPRPRRRCGSSPASLVDLGDGEHAAEPRPRRGRPPADRAGAALPGRPRRPRRTDRRLARATGAVDGFHLTPVEPCRDLERLVNGTVALLQHRGPVPHLLPGQHAQGAPGPRPARQPVRRDAG